MNKELIRRTLSLVHRGLCGEPDLLEICRHLVTLRPRIKIDDAKFLEAFDTIVAVESELDDIPGGAEQPLWARGPLQSKLKEKKRYLKEVEKPLSEALRTLAAVLEGFESE